MGLLRKLTTTQQSARMLGQNSEKDPGQAMGKLPTKMGSYLRVLIWRILLFRVHIRYPLGTPDFANSMWHKGFEGQASHLQPSSGTALA